ncbi:MAG: FHA domain-containing protein [Deltaproteobacteria bacterium]|nr:MAG: FHA domain-containing protein [Deltaproteobacteria bacterium]
MSDVAGFLDQAGQAGLTTVFDGERATVRRLRKAKLVVVAGPDQGLELEMSKARITGGRSVIADLVLQDKAVSGSHFEVIARDDGYRLRDLNSRNGTYVGDLKIREVYLRPGTTFRAGHTQIQFQTTQDVVEIELSQKDRFDQLIGSSAAMREIFATLEKVAPSDLTVMITGETGTGKEMVARAIHNASKRADKPFVVLDCGSIPKDLIESTLFGHEKGSFTGAVGQHRGCFEQANGGTIFLDEIGELDISLQPKLLRVLEQREIKRVGGDRTIKVDVRVIAATNRDLRAEVNANNFREDLYFRLSVVHIELPPLRERREDLPQLCQHFLREVASRRGVNLSFSQDAMAALVSHSWPGNVRELRNVVERAAALCDGPVISRADLVFGRGGPSVVVSHDLMRAGTRAAQEAAAKLAGGPLPPPADGPASFDPALFKQDVGFKSAKQAVVDAFERAYLAALLERNAGNITRSAQEAGLTRYHLRELLKRHGLSGSGAG